MAAPKAGLQKSLSRRVSFKEDTLSKSIPKPPPSDYSDAESQLEAHRTRRRCSCGCGAIFSSICAIVSIIIGVVFFLLLLAAGIYYAILQSNLPVVHLHRLDVYALNVTSSDGNTYLTTDIEIRLNTTNNNGRVGLGYTSLTATLMSEGIDLGSVSLPEMHQQPHTTNDVVVRTALNGTAVEEAAAEDLVDKSDRHLMVIDATVRGHIDFYLGSKKFNGFTFKVKCHSIDQSEIDNGHAPLCNSKMTLQNY